MGSKIHGIAAILACWTYGAAAPAEDWPQWRGPDRAGHAAGFDAPAPWPKTLTKLWRIPVEPGIASPVVAKGKIYVLSRDGEDEKVSCFRLADGKTVWSSRYAAPFIANVQASSPRLFPRSKGLGPFATPVLLDGTLYGLGVTRAVAAFDAASGKALWRREILPERRPDNLTYRCPPCNMACDEKVFEVPGECPDCRLRLTAVGMETEASYDGTRGNYYGAACSPLIHGDKLIAYLGKPDGGFTVAFDRRNGAELWRSPGPPPSSSSPATAEWHGVAQAVALTRESCMGVSLADGKTLWSFSLESNAQIVTPVIHRDLVLFATYRGPLTAIRIDRKNGSWSATEAWRQPEVTLYMSTPVIAEGALYGFSFANKGQFFAVDPSDGAVKWTGEGRQGDHASLVDAGSCLLALGRDGRLRALAKNVTQYWELASYQVSDAPVWAHPAVWSNKILIRDEEALTLWGF